MDRRISFFHNRQYGIVGKSHAEFADRYGLCRMDWHWSGWNGIGGHILFPRGSHILEVVFHLYIGFINHRIKNCFIDHGIQKNEALLLLEIVAYGCENTLEAIAAVVEPVEADTVVAHASSSTEDIEIGNFVADDEITAIDVYI